ncbi:MAG TPA: amidase family protein [Alphaproteobacteria bacterium]|nr:amidase family protein [Alphaproteobacteria bacterium]
MPSNEIIAMSAMEAVRRLRQREIAPIELVEAALARIERVEPAVNAMPIVCADRARAHARRLERMPPKEGRGWLGGLPIAIKDLTSVAGVRTTHGSPIYAGHVPDRSDLVVEILEARGAIVIGKSNTPEFGAGANTFNPVFGKTRNPWDTRLSSAGSSGGSAVALATGEVWLASGSDLGGSLRTPASFCSVVGLRPSPGRVPNAPSALLFDLLSVEGPMARTVEDTALMLDALAAYHPADPLSYPVPVEGYADVAGRRIVPRRIAFSPDLGISPVDGEVKGITETAALRFVDLGATVEQACPDFTEAPETFQVLRAASYVASMEPLYRDHRRLLKEDIIWNLEQGFALTAQRIGEAERARGRIFHTIAEFFARYDLLLCPTACTPPFDVEQRYPVEVAGHAFTNYVDWLRLVSAITLTSCPALSLPCGFTAEGLPVGLQLVGRPRGEAELLSAAAALEEALGLGRLTPIAPRSRAEPLRFQSNTSPG